MDEDKKDEEHVMFSSSWLGNIVVIAVVVLILWAAVAYKDFL